jgi:BirA family biotin operon repressor/biotin-[acetyl-CoA-carboxylase] ligase
MKILRYDTVDSTNTQAKKIAPDAEDFTVVTARRQRNGRGRLNRQWESPEGGLWLSIILKPPFFSSLLSFVAGLAVLTILRERDIHAQLKWPNDLLVAGKKICGILLEKHDDAVIMGIGINVNILQMNTENWTSMTREKEKRYDLDEILDAVLFHVKKYYSIYKRKEFSTIREEWKRYSCTIGNHVIVKTPSETIIGKAVDIDENGFLVLDTGKTVRAGDLVHLQNMNP